MADEERPDYYGQVLADLIAKRDQLNIAIAAIEALVGAGGPGSPGTPVVADILVGRRQDSSQGIASDAFFNMSVMDATEKLLKIVKKPQSANAIAKALEDGGLIHQSGNFVATVYTTLRRAAERGDRVTQVQKNWGLAEWYPGRPRNRDDGGHKKQRKAKRPKPAAARPKAAKESKTEAAAGAREPSSSSAAPMAVAS
jgi:hypothetical protein